MAHYMLWIHGNEAVANELLAELELADGGQCVLTPSDGCTDGPGVLVAWLDFASEGSSSGTYLPARQTWREAGGGRFWLGFDNDRPVRPADIVRAETCRGLEVTLADGAAWEIPWARYVPHRWGMNGVRVPKAPYEAFCARANEIFTTVAQHNGVDGLTIADAWSFCCMALAINYRLCPEIVELLELLDDRVFAAVVFATIEFDVIAEVAAQKKTA